MERAHSSLAKNDVHIKDGADVNSIMRDMMSVILEGTLDAEMDEELGYSKYDYKNKETDNSRNGYSQKTMHTNYGDMEIDVPRDRKGEFEPQVIKKYQNTVTQDMEEKIISMYAKGMTTADIESHLRDLYDIEISDSTISRITDKILPIVKEWQERPLEEVYAVVFMDAIHYHVRSEGRIVKRAVYIAIGIDMSGKKDVLGMYVGENESAKFWLSIMNSLKNRGVEEILITCVDGLTGFPQAIGAVYPHAEIQQCIIHQIRNSTKYVLIGSFKDYCLHPVFRFNNRKLLQATGCEKKLRKKQLKVCVNTDDLGVFDTNLEFEYALLYEALQKKRERVQFSDGGQFPAGNIAEGNMEYSDLDIMDYLDDLREMGTRAVFPVNEYKADINTKGK